MFIWTSPIEGPSNEQFQDIIFDSNVTSRWLELLCKGLKPEKKDKLLSKYSGKGECPLEAPVINQEIKTTLLKSPIKRDAYFVSFKNNLGSALSALGSSISLIVNDEQLIIDKMQLLQYMCDAGKF